MHEQNDDARPNSLKARRFDRPNYTQAPNLMFDELMRQLSGSQFKALCVVVRKTIGFHRDTCPITIDDISEMAGLSRSASVEAIAYLCQEGWVEKFHQQSETGRDLPCLYTLGVKGGGSRNRTHEEGPEIGPYEGPEIGPMQGALKSVGSIKEKKETTTTPTPSFGVEPKDPDPEPPGAATSKELMRGLDVLLSGTGYEKCDEEGIPVQVHEARSRSQWRKRKKDPKPKGLASRIADMAGGQETAQDDFRVGQGGERPATPRRPAGISNSGILDESGGLAKPSCPEPDKVGPVVDAWNAANPDEPVALTHHDYRIVANIREAAGDPEFADQYPDIMRRCAAMRKHDSPWCNLRWLFKAKAGEPPNWHRVAVGEFRWKEQDPKPKEQPERQLSQGERNYQMTMRLLEKYREEERLGKEKENGGS